jgi:hypothetical protein
MGGKLRPAIDISRPLFISSHTCPHRGESQVGRIEPSRAHFLFHPICVPTGGRARFGGSSPRSPTFYFIPCVSPQGGEPGSEVRALARPLFIASHACPHRGESQVGRFEPWRARFLVHPIRVPAGGSARFGGSSPLAPTFYCIPCVSPQGGVPGSEVRALSRPLLLSGPYPI